MSARPQQLGPLYNDIEADYSDIEDETDPRFGFDVSRNIISHCEWIIFGKFFFHCLLNLLYHFDNYSPIQSTPTNIKFLMTPNKLILPTMKLAMAQLSLDNIAMSILMEISSL